MDSGFYSKYKRKFLIGLGFLISLTCLALAKYNIVLGVFGFIVTLAGLYAFYFVDKLEKKFREREIQDNLFSQMAGVTPESQPVYADFSLAFLQVDDYDEVFQSLPDEQRPLLVAAVDKYLREWAASIQAYLRKDGREHYTLLLPTAELETLENREFPVLDEVRKISVGEHLPVTLSIGAGKGVAEPALLGQLAQQALNLAIERGGDQAIVKNHAHTWFYGGCTEAVGKRSQVRARVTTTKLLRYFEMAKNVVIMGHKQMDFDVLGAAMGLAELAHYYGKPVKIVVDHLGGAVERFFNLIAEDNPDLLCEKDEVLESVSSQTLLLLVDVHRPQMVIAPSLLSRAGYIAVIDHHRRGEEFLKRVSLSYIVPSASSTSELVGEIVRYVPDEFHLSSYAATALMAGLIVDTKRFTFNTGFRTFQVAAWLREAGADSRIIRELFTVSLDAIRYRAHLLQTVEIIDGKFAIAGNNDPFAEAQVAASRAADDLLEISGIEASFVLYPVAGGIRISARSVGTVNVHRIMEKLGGGGHFTVAAAFLPELGFDEAKQRLLEMLNIDQEEEY